MRRWTSTRSTRLQGTTGGRSEKVGKDSLNFVSECHKMYLTIPAGLRPSACTLAGLHRQEAHWLEHHGSRPGCNSSPAVRYVPKTAFSGTRFRDMYPKTPFGVHVPAMRDIRKEKGRIISILCIYADRDVHACTGIFSLRLGRKLRSDYRVSLFCYR